MMHCLFVGGTGDVVNLAQLQYFCKLAELQHYTKAAEELYITQPTLSNSISRLEDELGVPLFERKGRNVYLTKYGHEFYDHARAALETLERGTQLAQAQAGQLGGTIDIGAIYPIQRDYLPSLIHEYRNAYGDGPSISVHQGLTLPLVAGIEDDTFDLAFGAFVPGKEDKLAFELVLYQKLIVIAHSNNPLASQREIDLADLRGQYIVSYTLGRPIGNEVAALLTDAHLSANETCEDEITLASMVQSNKNAVGLTLETIGLSSFENLVRINLRDVPDNFHGVYLIYKKGTYKTPATQHFIETTRAFTWPIEELAE